MREKLIELIYKFVSMQILSVNKIGRKPKVTAEININALASFLIENGVVMPVRCENCIWCREDPNPDCYYCKLTGAGIWLEGFCNEGEPKESEE